MSEPKTINDTTIDKIKREIFGLRKEGFAVSIPYNRVDALKQIAEEHTTLSEEHADLTAKLKLAVEAINLTRIGLEGEVHHSKDIKTSHHCREMLQRLDSCLAKIGEQR